ncbi:FAD synthetase [Litchfieldella anticariensis FP35 = DSM 16096]|uniref:Riboflavin biosynthesis protein n=1 Tax=Litchfieldella anticariensis (strain DSM 16096 / CECT 5854 / CIP 108499 / LMG 22089 / FP35) TaxID=1121939 RepID=S2KDS4_LITA3|nr:bifunctional riboflavin kinase/FAD synthetase [Halomonas anticariensis]EPB99994.1 FAD synthetase [Halomonas anticariensis FP35 = DSM 16096]
MELIRGLHNLREEYRGCVATIGNFDGVHRGHQAILEQCRERAAALGLPVTVVVFEPQPREYFAGDQAPPRLTRLRDKVKLLVEHGAERVLCLPFNDALRRLTALEFIDRVLIEGLGVRHLVVGDDFRFGCDRAGDFALLAKVGREAGPDRGFNVEHTRTFVLDDERVSSSRVRTLLASGNFAQARRMLGRAYRLGGRVVADQQLGRTIGVPTANLPLLPLPLALRGVYAVIVDLADGRRYTAVANIGWRPTVKSTRPVLEVHLFDFDEELYGQRLTVIPCARLRGEIRFDDFETLKRQIQADLVQARRYFDRQGFHAVGRPGDDITLPLASAPLAREAATSDSSVGRTATGCDDDGHS